MINNENRVSCVVFDWAGTTVDFGCFAPLGAFMRVFEEAGAAITAEEARVADGAAEARPRARTAQTAASLRALRGKVRARMERRGRGETLRGLRPGAHEHAEDYCEPIPGVVDTVAELRRMGLKIGSTTGYTKEMMDIVAPGAAARGYAPRTRSLPPTRPARDAPPPT